jgi:diaminopimelate epimerase
VDGGLTLAGRRIAAGVDHAVFEDLRPETPLSTLARSFFRAHPHLERELNLTLVRLGPGGAIFARTFERGVGETLACGSGALAAAEFVASAPGAPVSVVVVTPGGAQLAVDLGPGDGPAVLTGEARLVYEGELAPEALARGC